MLLQASAPRPVLNVAEHPTHVVVQTLCKPGVSKGSVHFSFVADLENGVPTNAPLAPHLAYDIEGQQGFRMLEFYIPLWQFFASGERITLPLALPERSQKALTRQSTPVRDDELAMLAEQRSEAKNVASLRAEPGRAFTDLQLIPIFTSGFRITTRTAFRSEPGRYEERTLGFQLLLPISGGGIVRLADSLFDVSNPTLNPKAEPPRPVKDPVVENAFNRTHAISATSAEIERRRQQRIASASKSPRLPPHEE